MGPPFALASFVSPRNLLAVAEGQGAATQE